MQFRTEIKLKKGEYPLINYESGLFLIGSCFSDNIGSLFRNAKFNTLGNPFGVTYNPVSIAKQLGRIAKKDFFSERDIIEKEGAFNSYELHGSFDATSSEKVIHMANSRIEEANLFLKNCSHVYVTFGTAWVYELLESNEIVNNCHKKAGTLFSKRLLSADEVTTHAKEIIQRIRMLNKQCHILFTISPVRHLKDGFAENNLSKATLRLGLEELLQGENIHYFPSYEIVMDDLRDYRFFEKDLLHPSSEAIEYIWNKLVDAHMNEETISFMNDCLMLNKAMQHRPFNESSAAHKSFISKTLSKAKHLQETLKKVNFESEIELLESRLSE